VIEGHEKDIETKRNLIQELYSKIAKHENYIANLEEKIRSLESDLKMKKETIELLKQKADRLNFEELQRAMFPFDEIECSISSINPEITISDPPEIFEMVLVNTPTTPTPVNPFDTYSDYINPFEETGDS